MGIHFYREFEKYVIEDMKRHKIEEAAIKALEASTPSPPMKQEQGSDQETVIIAVSVAASITLVIIFVCAVFIRLFLKQRRERQKLRAKYDVCTTIPLSKPLLVNTQRQLSLGADFRPSTRYDSMDLVTERPQFESFELSKSEETNKKFQHKLYKFHSLETAQTGRNDKESIKLRRSKSVTSLDDERLMRSRRETNIKIAFSLKYVKNLKQVNLKLHNISELPSKTYGLDIYAVVYLFPRNNEGVNSRNVKGESTVKLEQTFLFDDLTLSETEKSTLRIALFYRKRVRMSKEEFLGELFLKCSDVDWSIDQPTRFEMEVNKNRAKRESTADKYLFSDLGSLLVCLEYQLAAKRMKVMVRKACNLPKSDRLIGRPAHYVVINQLKNKELLKTQETRTQGGYTPVWNQPFLFDLPGDNVNDFCFDFIVMRGKIRTKDGVVGHVMIGADSTKEGNKHWKEILSPRPIETAKWHSILPLINFKPNVETSLLKARKDS